MGKRFFFSIPLAIRLPSQSPTQIVTSWRGSSMEMPPILKSTRWVVHVSCAFLQTVHRIRSPSRNSLTTWLPQRNQANSLLLFHVDLVREANYGWQSAKAKWSSSYTPIG